MIRALVIAADLLRESVRRKWILALLGIVSLFLVLLAFTLEMDVVDGALAATRWFGKDVRTDIRSADVALRPIFRAASYVIFYGGIPFLILGCADFAVSLLSPGRIEHLLALPLRRWELLVGTYLGVLVLALGCALYASGGLVVLLGVKTGVWTLRPLLSAMLCALGFATVYAVMLACSVWVRSSAVAASGGVLIFALGIISGKRTTLAPLFEEGLGRSAFELFIAPFPRMTTLASFAAGLEEGEVLSTQLLVSMGAGFLLFALAALALAVWRFERTDY